MFYTYIQNNSGGQFQADHSVAHYVIVEADTAKEANARAQTIGIYFDGCDTGIDCACCGDRWYAVDWSDGTETPTRYGEPLAADGDAMWTKPGEAYAYIHFKDGTKQVFLQGN